MLKPVSGKEAFRNKVGNEYKRRKAYRHICDDMSDDDVKQQGIEVYLYKTQPFALTKGVGTFGVVGAGEIKYCPFCGVDINKEVKS